MERTTTVDFIVPGEMELTTAVRSVSNATMARDGNNALLTYGSANPDKSNAYLTNWAQSSNLKCLPLLDRIMLMR
jgi:hypothetical protein